MGCDAAAQRSAGCRLMRLHPALDGSGHYVDDVDRPGQLHLAVVRSNLAHGTIRGIDPEPALALSGVVRAILPDDLQPMPRIPIRTAWRPELEDWLQPVLAETTVRYVGQPVAAVLAEDPYVAEDAAEQVRVDLEPLPVVASDEPGWEEVQPVLKLDGRHGPVDELFEQADHVLRETFRIARRTGSPIETRGVVAEWQPHDGVLQMWGPTKFIWFTRRVVAQVLELPEDRVICHRVDVGGMFGTRGEVYPEDLLVAWSAQQVGRPVKWIEDRREHLLAINQSAEELHDVEVAVTTDGELLAYRDRVSFDMGAFARPIGSRVPALVIENFPGPYRWRGTQVEVACKPSHKTPTGTVRAPTRIGSNYVRERMVDAAALAVGLHPIEIRRRNLLTQDELPYERALDEHEVLLYEGGDYGALMGELIERAGGDSLLSQVHARRDAGELVGVGISTFLEGSGIGETEVAGLRLEASGRVTVLTTASEVGQGLDETLRRVAARRLGLDPNSVDVDSGSSFGPPGGRGTYGSRSTVFAGSATDAACAKLLDQIAASGAAALGTSADEVEVEPGMVRGAGAQVTWQNLAPLQVEAEFASTGPTFGFGMHMAVARVDADTGAVELERTMVGYDTGRVVRREGVEGQLIGGTVQGLGAALFERLAYGDEAQPQSASFVEYMLPTCADVPRVEAVVWEAESVMGNPLGARGAGEAGAAGAAAAVGNAIAAALGGVGPTELPLSPESVLQLVDQRLLAPTGG